MAALRITWDYAVLRRRERMHYRIVGDIEADVIKFAETLTGDVDIEDEGDRPRVLMRAAHGYTLRMRVDLKEMTLFVFGMFPPKR
jgi:hypothetical protein